MFKALIKFFTPAPVPTYRIVHDPELGYSAQHFDIWWKIITKDGTTGISAEYARGQLWVKQWCTTEKEAGERINRHSNQHGQSVIWSA